MNQDDFPAPSDGFVLTHFLVVSDQDRSRNFYQSLFDAQVLMERDPVILKVANSWLILNVGGGPTDDKPTVTLTTPPEPDHTSAFLNVPCCRHSKDLQRMDGQRRELSYGAEGPRKGNPCVCPRSRWPPD